MNAHVRRSLPHHSAPLVLLALLLTLLLALSACSDDDATTPEPGPADTPPLPTITTPDAELPAESAFLAVEAGQLQNLSPDLIGLSPAALAKLDEATVLDFRLQPGRRVIWADGKPCFPEGLEFTETYGWYPLARSQVAWPFVSLGEYEGSHYYLCTRPARWMYADLNCRMLGGHLASLTSAAENTYVNSAVQATLAGYCSFGFTDWGRPNNSWIWTSGETASWTNWAGGEPNNSGGEYFATLRPDGLWNDVNLSVAYPYVLERNEPLPAPEGLVSCASYQSTPLFIDGVVGATAVPHVQRQVYWKKVVQMGPFDAGVEYSREHSYTSGTSETNGMSFGWSIGISVSATWGFVSASIESEFHQDFNREVTISSEETVTDTYTAAPAPEGKVMVVALWQLRERFVITDAAGEPWSDPNYVLQGDLPYLDQGLGRTSFQRIILDAP